jgi:hypothetical protein
MTPTFTPEEKRLLERLLKRGGATLVVDRGGEMQITAYFNDLPLRDCRVRHG